MADISAQEVKKLREATGAGVLDCRNALQETDGDMDRAAEMLRVQGLAEATKRAGRATEEGLVDSYIHLGGKIGVLLEINCETDFVARTDEFRELAHNICMQIAAADPGYIEREVIPEDVLEQEKRILQQQAESEGKPPEIARRIVEGRLEKFYSQVCLLDQAYIRDADLTVGELLKEAMASLGENIQVRRFARFAVGQD
jgi:elongation factor Ts